MVSLNLERESASTNFAGQPDSSFGSARVSTGHGSQRSSLQSSVTVLFPINNFHSAQAKWFQQTHSRPLCIEQIHSDFGIQDSKSQRPTGSPVSLFVVNFPPYKRRIFTQTYPQISSKVAKYSGRESTLFFYSLAIRACPGALHVYQTNCLHPFSAKRERNLELGLFRRLDSVVKLGSKNVSRLNRREASWSR